MNRQKIPEYTVIANILIACDTVGMITDNIDENEDNDEITKDAHGNTLADGDSVIVIKDLKVKGTSMVLKQGTKIKNIRLNSNPEQIECNAEGMKGLVLKTEFLKKG